MTYGEAWAETGRDFDEGYARMLEESPLLALLGPLSLSTKPGKPGKDTAPEGDEKPGGEAPKRKREKKMNELWALPFEMAEQVLSDLASAKSNPQALVEGFPERKARGYELVGGVAVIPVTGPNSSGNRAGTGWGRMPWRRR